MDKQAYTNSLIHEKSPYLLQHAHNPVNWHPWGEEAFSIAKEKNLPVLVSIGYATCHWCHVMERESFEDPATAQVMNENFVCIKVDREERPDVDSVYMHAVQTMGKQGGWPLNMFVTPDGIPFYGGTYFPPNRKFGMPGFTDVLRSLVQVWNNDHDKIQKQGGALVEAIRKRSQPEKNDLVNTLSFNGEDRAAKLYEGAYDHLNSGFKFQSQNKFPPSMGLSSLLRHHRRTGYVKSLEMAENTLATMKNGGIYDQIGGGLSRYSTDYRWLVPHFEKMLYDNALFVTALVETYQVTGKEKFADWVHDVVQYIERDMTSEEGAFFSAEDADSEGVEGKFYVWTQEEIEKLLGRQTASIAIPYFNVTQQGNFEGKNILHVTRSTEAFAREQGLPESKVKEELARARALLLEGRDKRIRPLRDDKTLTSWNGLMITALAKAGRALDDPGFTEKAEKALDFIFKNLQDKNGKLLRRYREGEARFDGYLFDYTSIAVACLELYETTYKPVYLHQAFELMTAVQKKFASENGAYYETANDAEDLIVRQISSYDGVEPSGNSNAALAFLRLAAYRVQPDLEEKAVNIFLNFYDELMEYGLNVSYMMQAMHLYLGGLKEVAVVGRRDDPSTKEMLTFIRKGFFPQAVFAFAYEDEIETLGKEVPLLSGRKLMDRKATAYVCRRGTCLPPVTSLRDLQKLLDYE
ncbi:MAG: thioredoxin domain-containing protein [Nitrospinota bacterium]|nr:thioredoxin domain-containing protein [Nitrospinota bacterium]